MRIVLVSPFAAERTALHQLLVEDGHEVSAVTTTEQGLDLASAAGPDAYITDAQVVGLDGLAVVRALFERGLQPRVILLCPRVSVAFEKDGVICLTKPIDLAQLRRCLGSERVIESRVA